MKKVKLTGKLSLSKETIAKLNDEQMKKVLGGGLAPISNHGPYTCISHPCLLGWTMNDGCELPD